MGNPHTGTLTKSGGPDKILHKATFSSGPAQLALQRKSTILFENNNM